MNKTGITMKEEMKNNNNENRTTQDETKRKVRLEDRFNLNSNFDDVGFRCIRSNDIEKRYTKRYTIKF